MTEKEWKEIEEKFYKQFTVRFYEESEGGASNCVEMTTSDPEKILSFLHTEIEKREELQRLDEDDIDNILCGMDCFCGDCGGAGYIGYAKNGKKISCEKCGGHEDALGKGIDFKSISEAIFSRFGTPYFVDWEEFKFWLKHYMDRGKTSEEVYRGMKVMSGTTWLKTRREVGGESYKVKFRDIYAEWSGQILFDSKEDYEHFKSVSDKEKEVYDVNIETC